jgi:hypothetical protein
MRGLGQRGWIRPVGVTIGPGAHYGAVRVAIGDDAPVVPSSADAKPAGQNWVVGRPPGT